MSSGVEKHKFCRFHPGLKGCAVSPARCHLGVEPGPSAGGGWSTDPARGTGEAGLVPWDVPGLEAAGEGGGRSARWLAAREGPSH